MENYYSFNPSYAIPPMETLKEVLEDRDISLIFLSKLSEIDHELLLEIMQTKRQIDEPIATKLEKALEIPASFWLNLEQQYQATLKRLSNEHCE